MEAVGVAERLVATGCGQADPEAAANYLLRAHFLEPTGRTRGLLLEKLALLGRHVEARRLAAQLADSPDGRGPWFLHLADYLLRHGDGQAVREFFLRGGDDATARSLSAFVLDVFAVFADLLATVTRVVGGPRLVVSIPVWGDAHTRRMLDVLFPVLSAEGNLPALAAQHDVRVLVYTTERDAHTIGAHPAFARVSALAPVHLLPMPDALLEFAAAFAATAGPGERNPRYLLQNLGSYVSHEWARRTHGDVVNLWPDHVYDESYLGTIGAGLAGDPSAFVCPAFRLGADADPLLAARDGVLALPMAACVDLVCRTLPAENYADAALFGRWPLQLVWRVGDEGLLVRANHYLPCLVRGRAIGRPLHPSTDPIDGFFLHRFLGSIDAVRAVARPSGSAALCAMDVGPNPLVAAREGGPLDVAVVGRWLRQFVTPIHRGHFRTSTRYFRTAPTGAWAAVEAEAAQTVNAILAYADD